MKKVGLVFAGLFLFLGACATNHTVTDDSGRVVGEVQQIGPSWAANPGKWEKDHKNEKAFVGVSTVRDLAIARTDAKFGALASLADRVRTDVHHLFVTGITTDSVGQGEAGAERSIENGILGVSQAVVSGAHVDKYRIFYTKRANGDVKYTTYALITMSNQSYEKAVADTIDGLKKEIKDPRARDLVEEMKKRFLSGSPQ